MGRADAAQEGPLMPIPVCDPNPWARRGECIDEQSGQRRIYTSQPMGLHIASNPDARYNTSSDQWGTVESPGLQPGEHHQSDGSQPVSPIPVQPQLPTLFGLDLSNPLVLLGIGFAIWYVMKGR